MRNRTYQVTFKDSAKAPIEFTGIDFEIDDKGVTFYDEYDKSTGFVKFADFSEVKSIRSTRG